MPRARRPIFMPRGSTNKKPSQEQGQHTATSPRCPPVPRSKHDSRAAPGAFFTRQAQVHGAEQQHSSSCPTRLPTSQPQCPWADPHADRAARTAHLTGTHLAPAGSLSISGSPTWGAENGQTTLASCGSAEIRAAPGVQQQGGHQAQHCLYSPRCSRQSRKGIRCALGPPSRTSAPHAAGSPSQHSAASPGGRNGRIKSPAWQSLTEWPSHAP
ncbi:hypothetical protein NDU88_009193 [Pleurodeles waltl]|uniref:Uncharacterized protein n=1 Tax=Pleurodeles waltl TaxID=8319 RepID=A0AAV7QWW6_PLEWA|nr:hypothetical protein NDU88_009193 [Pleurodeles waltl]